MRYATCGVPSLKLIAMLMAVMLSASSAQAHCDGLDGPVVTAARKALATGDVAFALVWVRKSDDGEVRQAFERTMSVRTLSPEARELADHYFFETVVRIHRAGEGAPYSGLKPAGPDLGPAIPAADRALDSGSIEPVVRLLTDAVVSGLQKRFRETVESKSYDPHDVEGGRRYVRAYVAFLHYVEQLYQAAQTQPHGHFAEKDHLPAATGHAADHVRETSAQDKQP